MFVENHWLSYKNLIRGGGRRTPFRAALRQSLYAHCLIPAIVIAIHILPAHPAPGQQLSVSTRSAFVQESSASVAAVGSDLLSVQAPARNLWTFNAVADYEPAWHTPVFYVTSFVIDEHRPTDRARLSASPCTHMVFTSRNRLLGNHQGEGRQSLYGELQRRNAAVL